MTAWVHHHQTVGDVLVFSPEHFEDALEAVLAVREQHTVVLNLSRMEPELAQQPISFVAESTPWTDINIVSVTTCFCLHPLQFRSLVDQKQA